jgi:hypothetical protein
MATGRRTSEDTEPDARAVHPEAGAYEAAVDRAGGDERVLVVGGGQVGRRLAGRLAETRTVHHLDADPGAVTDPRGYDASHAPDLASPTALAAAGVTGEELVVVATGADGRSLLVTQQLRTRFGAERVLVVVEDPRNREAFDLQGVTVVCAGGVLSEAVDSALLDGESGAGTETGADSTGGRSATTPDAG